MPADSVLMIGFGGPQPGCCGRRAECPCPTDRASDNAEEARCFVAGILGDNPARAKRVEEIVAHYRHLGGFSPYNELTEQQARALTRELAKRGHQLPVYTSYRHWRPWPKDVLRQMHADGCRETLLCVLSSQQSSVSWDWYIKYAAEAVAELGDAAPRIAGVLKPWWNDPGFITALAENIRAVHQDWPEERWQQAALIFSAHAIPEPLEQTSPYRAQFAEGARLAAEACGHPEHHLAFQSQPDTPGMPWSSPAIADVVAQQVAAGSTDIIVQASGFLVDHVEVLYDLDHEVREQCRELGVTYHRAACVHDHPAFIAMLADRVAQQL